MVRFQVFAGESRLFHSSLAQAHGLAGHGYALASHTHALAAGGAAGLGRLSGGGLAHFIVRLFIWHVIWRAGRGFWHIPTVGPFVVVLLIVAVVALVVLRKQRARDGGTIAAARRERGPAGNRATGNTAR